ncbi:MAG: DUF3467 domain-containing protein [Rikenellaceae bacterium]
MASEQSKEMNIVLDEDQAQGVYSNLVVISHSQSEFVMDFASLLPGMQKPKVRSRIILSPEHAKRLLLSLQENVVKYESANGPIQVHGRQLSSDSEFEDLGFNVGEA